MDMFYFCRFYSMGCYKEIQWYFISTYWEDYVTLAITQVVSKAMRLKKDFDAARAPKMEPNPDYGFYQRSGQKIYVFQWSIWNEYKNMNRYKLTLDWLDLKKNCLLLKVSGAKLKKQQWILKKVTMSMSMTHSTKNKTILSTTKNTSIAIFCHFLLQP